MGKATKKSKEDAISEVPKYVTPSKCFVWLKNSAAGYEVIPGTPCAHYVAHQLELTGKSACCDQGYLLRVSDVIAALTKIDVKDVQVNDVWARIKGEENGKRTEPSSHCGMVVAVERDQKSQEITKVTIRHDSSGQKRLADNDWKQYFGAGGNFYSKTGQVRSPHVQAKADFLRSGLPYVDVLRLGTTIGPQPPSR